MAEIKWIKLSTDIFNNRKIKQIRKMPDGEAIVGIWLQILCLAGQINNNGMVYFTKDVAYTEDMLSAELDRPISTIRLALITFQKFNMLNIVDDILLISNWEKYQSTDKLEKIREQNRIRQSKYRENFKNNVTIALPITQNNAIEPDKELDIDKEDTTTKSTPYSEIKNLFNTICVSYSQIKVLSDARKKTIKARFNIYSLDDFKTLFEKAEASNFLKGKNNNDWTATFDWLIKDTNMAKVLDGNYDNKDNKQVKAEKIENFGVTL